MFFAALYTLNPNVAEKQTELRPAHFAHAANAKVNIVMAGPTQADDGTVNGGLFVLEAPSFAQARAHCDEDPYTKNKVWTLSEFRIFDKKRG